MSPEYVKLTPAETTYGETNLLKSQISLISMLKAYNEYCAFRKEELFFKIELKKKLGEIKEFLDHLNKTLPESKFIEEQEEREKMKREITEKVESYVTKSKKGWEKDWKEKGEPKRKSFAEVVEESERYHKHENDKDKAEKVEEKKMSPLDQELEEIRKKLERLQ